jgi:hypothetical protein
MARANGRNPGNSQDPRNAQHGGQQSGNRDGSGADGRQQAQNGQGSQQTGQGPGARPSNPSDPGRGDGTRRSGDVGGPTGDVRTGGGQGADGTVWGNINTGNNQYGQGGRQPAHDEPSGSAADTERTFQQELRELNQLRQMVKGDPQAAKEAEALARQMQNLDPRRFPGNPAIVEQMHSDVSSSVDRSDLQVEHSASATLESRTGNPSAVPDGYQDAVAEYYRQLSKAQ